MRRGSRSGCADSAALAGHRAAPGDGGIEDLLERGLRCGLAALVICGADDQRMQVAITAAEARPDAARARLGAQAIQLDVKRTLDPLNVFSPGEFVGPT